MSVGGPANRIHPRRPTEDVNRQDRGRSVGDGGLDRAGVEVEAFLVDVDEERCSSLVEDAVCRGDEAVR